MLLADYIMLGVIAVVAILGLVVGFSGGLKFFTSGIFGIVISVVVTYFLLGIVNSWQFVQDLLSKLNGMMGDLNPTLVNIIDQAILAVILFIIVQIVRIIIVKLIAGLFEIDNGFFKVINRILGIVVIAAVAVILGLLAFQIIYWVGGATAHDVAQALEGSVFRLDWLYENNPLRTLADYFTN